MTCKRKREKGGRRRRRERERGRRDKSVCSRVRRGWEALAELYINKFVKWASVVEYSCVSVCGFFCERYHRFSHHEAQKPRAAVLHNTLRFSPSSRLHASSARSSLSPCLSCCSLFCYDVSDFLHPYYLCKKLGFWINSLRKCRASHWQLFPLIC